MTYAPSLKIKAEAELELRRRRRARQVALRSLPLADFAARTKIEVPTIASEQTLIPFHLWSEQLSAIETMERDRLIVFLKARQLGISRLACLYALRLCTLWPRQPVLTLSRSQDDADALIHHISTMYHEHSDKASTLPRLLADNTGDLLWDNDSTVVSLTATKNAGRGHAAALAILDEWAFYQWPGETLASVKPTIDAGGKLFVISSADALGSEYHRFWNNAKSGANGYTSVFLSWQSRPDRGTGWRDQKLIESSGDTATIYREYPANDIEAFAHAAGLVYDVWSDGPSDGNVTEAAEFTPDGGSAYWATDDGYAGSRDDKTGHFTADSHPRVFLLIQERPNGQLCVFYEDYRVKTLADQHIADILALDYPLPDYVATDSSAAELRGRLHNAGLYTRGKPPRVEESIKALRRMLAPDANGFRRLIVHPRCKHLRAEMASYRYDQQTEKPVKEWDHGPDCLRYFCWTKRLED